MPGCQVFPCVAHNLQKRIISFEYVIHVRDDDTYNIGINQALCALLTLAQGIFLCFAMGNILHEDNETYLRGIAMMFKPCVKGWMIDFKVGHSLLFERVVH